MTFGAFSTEQCKLRGQSLVYSEQRLGSGLYLTFLGSLKMVKRLDKGKSLATASSRGIRTVLYTAGTGIFNILLLHCIGFLGTVSITVEPRLSDPRLSGISIIRSELEVQFA